MNTKMIKAGLAGLVLSVSGFANAGLIDFTGGTVHLIGGGTAATDTTTNYGNVDYYEEDGVLFDFLGASGNSFSYNVGDYYGVGNDVIHGHWADGPHGDMESIRVNKVDNTLFDLNYFKITTNTDCGGCAASGNEEVYINALADGVNISYSLLLPSDDWGFLGDNDEIFLGAEFNNIKAFSFTYGANAVGFGLDEFYIDIEAPNSVPEPSTLAIFALGIIGLASRRSKVITKK